MTRRILLFLLTALISGTAWAGDLSGYICHNTDIDFDFLETASFKPISQSQYLHKDCVYWFRWTPSETAVRDHLPPFASIGWPNCRNWFHLESVRCFQNRKELKDDITLHPFYYQLDLDHEPVYMQIICNERMHITPADASTRSIHLRLLHLNTWQSFYIGILFTVFISYAMAYLASRQRQFFWLCLSVPPAAIYFMLITGRLLMQFGINLQATASWSNLFFGLLNFTILRFGGSLLDCRTKHSGFCVPLHLLCFISLVTAVLSSFRPSDMMLRIQLVCAILGCLIIFLRTLPRIKKSMYSYLSYEMCWAVYLAFCIYTLLHTYELISLHVSYPILFAVVIYTFMLFAFIAIALQAIALQKAHLISERENIRLLHSKHKADILAREASLKTLRYQLNPHFLFNTLNGIISQIRTDPDTARQVSRDLSSYLRSSLKGGEQLEIALREEIENTRVYLAIEQNRFGEQLEVEIDIPNHLKDKLIPTMLLQPLIENAIRYGMRTSPSPLRVNISAVAVPDGLTIKVRNSGTWYHWVNRRNRPHVGLNNLRERLRLMFPQQHKLTISRGKEEVTVAITMLDPHQ